jgi:hypothetical protein
MLGVPLVMTLETGLVERKEQLWDRPLGFELETM